MNLKPGDRVPVGIYKNTSYSDSAPRSERFRVCRGNTVDSDADVTMMNLMDGDTKYWKIGDMEPIFYFDINTEEFVLNEDEFLKFGVAITSVSDASVEAVPKPVDSAPEIVEPAYILNLTAGPAALFEKAKEVRALSDTIRTYADAIEVAAKALNVPAQS